MVYTIANEFFYNSLSIKVPKEIDEAIHQTLSIFADNFDISIPFQSGGYVIVVTEKAQYQDVLQQLNTSCDMSEYTDVIETNEGMWKQDYYELATEYGIAVIYFDDSKGGD